MMSVCPTVDNGGLAQPVCSWIATMDTPCWSASPDSVSPVSTRCATGAGVAVGDGVGGGVGVGEGSDVGIGVGVALAVVMGAGGAAVGSAAQAGRSRRATRESAWQA